MFNAPKLTNAGKALYYDNMAGTQIVFTTIQLGSGNISWPIAPMTALVTPVVTIDAEAKSVSGQYAEISGHFSNAQLADGFYFREIGVFAADPDYPNDRSKDILYCYQNAYDTADFIPAASVETVEKNIAIPVIIGDATAVSCTLSRSMILATMEDLDNHNEDQNAHGNTFVKAAEKGKAGGVATLGNDGILLKEQRPKADGLFMPDGSTKISEKINGMETAMLLALAAAAPYSTSQTYALGAYCTRDGKLYKANQAISAAEEWTAAHWTETTMGAELIEISITLANKAPAGFGIGTIAKNISGRVLTEILKKAQSGFYEGNNVVGAPSTTWYYFKIISDSQNYAIVIAYGFDGKLWRSAYRGGVLGSWVKIYDQSNKPTPSEIGAVAKKPSLSDSEKDALKNLALDYYYANNNNGTENTDDDYSNFIYVGNASSDAYTDISKAYTADTKGRKRTKINCQLLCQLIWMGVNPSKFVDHQSDYSPSFGESDLAFNWGYKPKYYKREKAYGLFKSVPKDADAGFVGDEFYGFKKPYDDTYEYSYSNNSYYSEVASEKFALVVDGNVTNTKYTNTAHQMLKGYCWEGDLAEELYSLGCEVDYSDIEVGDLIFSSVSVINDSTSLYHQQSFRNISHAAIVYEVDKENNIIKVIEATSLENKPIIKNSLAFGGNYDITRAANNLTNIVMVARHPHAFGISCGIGNAFAKMKTPDNRLEPIGWGSNSKQKKYKNTVILTAPNGGKYKLSVNDEGTLTTVPMLNDYSE